MAELAKMYKPADVEAEILQRWNDARAFHAEPSPAGSAAPQPYCIVIPPPNVTAALHMGHALNNTLQDILIRWRRMAGDNAVWIPGTDHAGIATQTVVEKRVLAEQGKKRTDFQREEFVKLIQAWKDEYEATITNQLKVMGCSCDWERQRFTMDAVCAKAVREAFFQLFKDGLIYRGKRLVNWDPATQTALADDEVENEEIDGQFFYLKYPLADKSGFVTVATTRPETMLGDTAVALNPKDPRAAQLRGKKVRLPIVNREIPLIEDDYVTLPDPDADDPKARYSSGFLKVTPAHDENDWLLGQRHNLPVVNVFSPTAAISKDHGWPIEDFRGGDEDVLGELLGKDRFEAREIIVEWFRANGLLEEVKPYRHSVGHSYRSHVPIEPYLSDQWYVATTKPTDRIPGEGPVPGTKIPANSLAGAALQALDIAQRTGAFGDLTSGEKTTCPEKIAAEQVDHRPEACATSGTGGGTDIGDTGVGGTGVPPVKSTPVKSTPLVKPPHYPAITADLLKQKRNLPHWQAGGSTYFITFRLRQGVLSPSEQSLVLQTCLHWHNQRVDVHLAAVMPDHVHLLLTPLKRDQETWHSLSELLHSIKSFTAHAINKQRGTSGPIWQDESYDRIVRDEAEFEEKWQYIWTNPQRAGLVKDPQNYPFTHCPGWGPWLPPGTSADHRLGDDAADHRRDACATNACATNACATGGTGVPPVNLQKHNWQGNLRIIPDRYARTFQAWHENIRDWCISRQLWWGHRIPVWSYPRDKKPPLDLEVSLQDWEAQNRIATHSPSPSIWNNLNAQRSENIFARFICVRNPDDREVIETLENAGFVQDPDVLDTWFSSALWPISTLGWPDDNPALQTWNPSNTLTTAREIITLWVSRMVMFNLYFRGCLPFTDVFVHAMIQDGEGRKMSKSLGNGVDPLDIIHSHGSDAMRFTLAQMTTQTQDVRMPVVRVPDSQRNTSPKFDAGRNFANKLWNAVRFALGNLQAPGSAGESAGSSGDDSEGDSGGPLPHGRGSSEDEALSLADRWILSRLARVVNDTNAALTNYEFSDYAQGLYDFTWRDLCDWYVEAVKPTLKDNPTQRAVLAACVDVTLRLLHPVMPFITEKLWEHLNEIVPNRARNLPGSLAEIAIPFSPQLIRAAWPAVPAGFIDPQVEVDFEFLRQTIVAIRQVRTTYKVPPKQKVICSAKAPPELAAKLLIHRDLIATLANIDPGEVGPGVAKPATAAATIVNDVEVYLHDLIDAGAEKIRLTKRADELQKNVQALTGRLANKSYLDRAPAHLVQQTHDQLATAQKELATVREQLADL